MRLLGLLQKNGCKAVLSITLIDERAERRFGLSLPYSTEGAAIHGNGQVYAQCRYFDVCSTWKWTW